ncbi:MAG: sulfate ABC transporter ATP-binding protein [Eggerthellaceae bacterium]|nr:sulfate ABC transporter ATP-binding protein [Eggerthellaceae bacterium]
MFVEVKNVEKHFGDFQALDDISFGVEQGELVALLGPSGSGKTTILRAIAGLDRQDAGDIVIDGRVVNDIPGSERGIGFVFQNYALFRYMTVAENIAFGLKVKKVPKADIDARVKELVELIGLSGKEDNYPNELSGGQRQRVAFARALAPNPQVLLLDEPFGAIDAKIRKELRSWLREIVTQLHITSLFVTHDQEEAFEVSDRVIIMSNGRIEQIGAPAEIYSKPATGFVACFAGNAPMVEDYGRFNGFEKERPGSAAVVRPECVEAFRKDNPEFADVLPFAQPCVLEDISFRGFYRELTLNVDGVRIYAHRGMGRRSQLDVGESMMCYIDRLYIVDDKSNEVEILENSLLQ